MKYQKEIGSKVLKYIKDKNLISPQEKVCVAVSGGADSICLLDLLLKLRDKLKIEISACHFNHRLRGEESDGDQKFVETFCFERGIECIVGRAKKDNLYKSENEAREARYSFFQKVLAGEGFDKIAIAHNLNDSAETVLLRTIRGSGYRGLKSIPAQRGKFCRPLLQISRIEIEKYLQDQRLQFRVDNSNANLDFNRNFVRHRVLPLLSQINPNIVETLGSTATSMEDDYSYLLENAESSLQKMIVSDSTETIVLDRADWIHLHPAMKRLTLRLAIEKKIGLEDISAKQIEEVAKVIEQGEGEKFKSLPHSLRIMLRNGNIIMIISNKESK